MNIIGFGLFLVEKLFDVYLIVDVVDIYCLSIENLLILDGIKEKFVIKIYYVI